MSKATIRIPTPLRPFTNGAAEVQVEGSTVAQALDALGLRHQGILERVLGSDGQVRGFVNIYVGEANVKSLGGLQAPLPDAAVISIVPAVAGGAGASQRRLQELRAAIPQLNPHEAYERQGQGAVLIDIRDQDELAQGVAAGSKRISRGFLELKIEQEVPDPATPLLVMCASGVRSLFAAESLLQLGYRRVASVVGGFNAWNKQGLPVDNPRLLTDEERERYGRHLTVPEVGEAGQVKLLESKVLLVGAGGLGSPAAYYLAAAGVGTLGLVDDDVVDRSNLQRQILHTEDRVGQLKVRSARKTLQALNPSVEVREHAVRLTSANVEGLFTGYDVIVDGTDNFPTRYLVNDACVKLGLPNVHGSVYRFEGQVSVFWPGRKNAPGPCYRCLYPSPPPPELAPSCAEAGVLGVLPGVVGLLQAVETIKLLLGIGEPLVGRLLQYDALETRFTTLRMERDPECDYCATGKPFPGYVEMEHACSIPATSSLDPS
jgi:molybdopterin/thiamine biosynthesis adenylyltransferase/molybdopterin converting factor small subunit